MKFQQWHDCGLSLLLFVENVSSKLLYLLLHSHSYISHFSQQSEGQCEVLPRSLDGLRTYQGAVPARYQNKQMFNNGICWAALLQTLFLTCNLRAELLIWQTAAVL